MKISGKITFARSLLIFCYGLFTIAAQGLLFREFITTFEGNDIGVGAFFGSWFLWVGLGAVLAYRYKLLAEKLLGHIELLFLAYIPAFVLQWILILQVRELAGIESYDLFPVRLLFILSVVVNAPVSIITGMFFPIACRWVGQDEKLPVSRVYITEAAGSFLGGLGVTVLLATGTSSVRIFFILALIVAGAVFIVQVTRVQAKRWAGLVVTLGIVACLAVGADKTLASKIKVFKWSKLLPKETLVGSFHTAQAEYLYGLYQGQWVVLRQGSTCEVLPDRESAGRIAAIGLCQNPDAKRVLVIGSGLGLCDAFLQLGRIERVTWTHCDNEYVKKLQSFLPDEYRVTDKRFRPFAGDVRSLPPEEKQYYDIVILNLPDATSSVLNRYYTLEFYRQAKELLAPGGVLQVRISGGENIMGTELVNLGASTKLTLKQVFSRFVIAPGDETWFVASDSETISGKPGELVERFAAIQGAGGIFPPEGLFSVYLPERARFAEDSYASADLPQRLLINRDVRPLAHLYSLLLAAKQSGAVVTRFVKDLALAGLWPFVIPILVFAGLRIIYVLKTRRRHSGFGASATRRPGHQSDFNSMFLVFSAGWVGIGVVIVLMYLYQTRFGSLYLHIGVISSIFMIGLTAGGALSRYLLVNRKIPEVTLLSATVLAHIAVLAAVGQWPQQHFSHLTFAIAFVLSGLCTGMYFPLAAGRLAACGLETGRAASTLETADHIGAAVGAFLTGLMIVPVLGTKVTLLVFAVLLGANLPLAALAIYKPQKIGLAATPPPAAGGLRRLGYTLFGVGACLVLCSNVLAAAGASARQALPYQAVQALAEQLRAEPAAHLWAKTGSPKDSLRRKINYYKLTNDEDKSAGYIFSSRQLAPDVRGFGGKMNLAIRVDANGELVDFHILKSNETPTYLDLLSEWYLGLSGRNLFAPAPFDDVQAVSGATVSSEAVISALAESGHRFAAEILGQSPASSIEHRESRIGIYLLPDVQGTYLISAFILALIVTFRGTFAMRLVVLSFTFIVGGLILNSQYSSEQIATLLSGYFPAIRLTGTFLLVVAVPVFAALFGNYYCGYICPFGAAQELAGYLLGRKFQPDLTTPNARRARFVKYAVLLVAVSVFFISRDRGTLQTDPLIAIFSLPRRAGLLWATVAVALVGSVFYGRFWCRYLCPAGAFLSLLGGAAPFKRLLPAKRFGRCEFGVASKAELDCIFCDRCRYQSKRATTRPVSKFEILRSPKDSARTPNGGNSRLGICLLVPVLVVAFFISTVSLQKLTLAVGTGFGPTSAVVSAGGQSRDVDMRRVKEMIRQKRLSDHEAEFYKKVKKD